MLVHSLLRVDLLGPKSVDRSIGRIYLSINRSIDPSIYLPFDLSGYLSIYANRDTRVALGHSLLRVDPLDPKSIDRLPCRSIYLIVDLSIYLSTDLSTFPSI